MGEFATYNRQDVKIGTCEAMYYLRWDDRQKVQRLPGNADPSAHPEGLRFRIPWPDEDDNGPGNYEPFRSELLPDCEPEGDLPPGTYQLHHPETGLLLNVDCHHGRKLPDTGPGVRAHWNGRPPHWFRLPSTGIKCCPDGRLLPVIQCRGCGEMWRLDDWGPVLAAVADPVLRDRLDAYSRVGREVPA